MSDLPAPLSQPEPLDSDLFLQAAERGDVGEIKRLASIGADIHTLGEAALYRAVFNSHTALARFFCEQGVSVSRDDNLPILMAALRDDVDMVDLLIKYGADVDAQNGAALFFALGDGRLEVAKALLAHGAVFTDQSPDSLFTSVTTRGELAADCRQNIALAWLVRNQYLNGQHALERLSSANTAAALGARALVESVMLRPITSSPEVYYAHI